MENDTLNVSSQQKDGPAPSHTPLSSERTLEKQLTRKTGQAIGDFNLISEGDRILVAISGGKDSWAMLHLLELLRRRAPVRFELIAVNIDQGYGQFRQDLVEKYVAKHGYNYHMEDFDIASIVDEKSQSGSTPCALCSRLRRGALYGYAEKYQCNKIALGHHLDDLIETFVMNSFFNGRIASMAPKLQPENNKHTVIRPLIYVREDDILSYARQMEFPIVCCECPLMCGETVHGDFKRRYIKGLLKDLEEKIPHIKNSLLSSLTNVRPSHLLDRQLWDFK